MYNSSKYQRLQSTFLHIKYFCQFLLEMYNDSKFTHYNDVIMGAMASQIAILTIVYSTVYSGDQRKHQSSASLAFVRGIHRWSVNSPHKGPVTRKRFPFDNVIMWNTRHNIVIARPASLQGSCTCGSIAFRLKPRNQWLAGSGQYEIVLVIPPSRFSLIYTWQCVIMCWLWTTFVKLARSLLSTIYKWQSTIR